VTAPVSETIEQTRSADEIRDWIVREVAQALHCNPSDVDPAAPLHSHGVDSMSAISITAKLSTWLNRNLTATLLWDHPTIQALAAHLADSNAALKPALPHGVIAMQTSGKGNPIFFFPGVGGHPVSFAPLVAELGKSWPCYGLPVPGLDDSTEPVASVEAIAGAMVRTLRLVQKQGPYQLAGYSFGGLLAYEAARQLELAQEKVSMLAIFDTFTPTGHTPRPVWQRAALHAYLLTVQSGRIAYLRDKISRRRHAGDDQNESKDPRPDHDVLAAAKVKAIHKMNRQAGEGYRPKPFPGSILFFAANARQNHNIFYRNDPAGGWGKLCDNRVHVIPLPGSHLTILDPSNATIAAEKLRPHLTVS
jgi:thioesterase domain-containing protein/acyl carrier protein